jgi:hypothetical protein
MNNSNLQQMSLKELRTYVLTNREDDRAFQVYIDRLHSEAKWTTHPPLKSVEDMESYPNFIEKLRRDFDRR